MTYSLVAVILACVCSPAYAALAAGLGRPARVEMAGAPRGPADPTFAESGSPGGPTTAAASRGRASVPPQDQVNAHAKIASSRLLEYRQTGQLSAADYNAYRRIPAELAWAVYRLRTRGARAAAVDVAFVLSTSSRMMTPARAHILCAIMRANAHHYGKSTLRPSHMSSRDFAFSRMPRGSFRYRFGYGWQFHPSAALQSILLAHDRSEEATFLVQMEEFDRYTVPRSRNALPLAEYYFPYLDAQPGWSSSLPQARLMLAYNYAYLLTAHSSHLVKSRKALELLLAPLASGGFHNGGADGSAWFPQYPAKPHLRILNSQLTVALSLSDLAGSTPSETVRADARLALDQAQLAIRTSLPEFDTGWWSRYGIGMARDASIGYHRYHAFALIGLAGAVPEPEIFRTHAARFLAHDASACALSLKPRAPLYVSPNADGRNDRASFDCTATKPGHVSISLRRGRTVLGPSDPVAWVNAGPQTLRLPSTFGRKLPDGRYVLTARLDTLLGDPSTPSTVTSSQIFVDMRPPLKPVLRVLRSRSGVFVHFTLRDPGNAPVRWTVRTARGGRTLRRFSAAGWTSRRGAAVFLSRSLLRRLSGQSRSPLGVSIVVIDRAGNSSRGFARIGSP